MKVADIYIQLANNSVVDFYTYKLNVDAVEGNCVVIDINNKLKVGYISRIYEKDEQEFNYSLKDVLLNVSFLSLNTYQKNIFQTLYEKTYSDFVSVYNIFFKDIFKLKIDIEYYQDGKLLSLHNENKKKINGELQRNKMIEKKVVIQNSKNILKELHLKVKDKYPDTSILTNKQLEGFNIILNTYNGNVSNKKFMQEANVSNHIINMLVTNNFIEKIYTNKQFNEDFLISTDLNIKITDEQQKVVSSIQQDNEINLLHGVTASGKTEIYMKLIRDIVEEDISNQVLLIAPQMSLALQLLSRVQGEFDNVIIYHEQLTSGEKVSFHEQVKDNQCQIVIGTKESLLLPFDNLKMIIIDEEHAMAYKNKGNVKYHIYDLLQPLQAKGIKIVLGSATPSIESYAKAQKKVYKLIEMKTRYNNYDYPEVKFIKSDVNKISDSLREMININTNLNRTSLIYFHKVGYAKKVECNNCYTVFKCSNCNTTQTYYKEQNILKCQFCGLKEKYNNHCNNCHSDDINYENVGIEQFTEIIKNEFSNLKVVMLDSNMKKQEILNVLTRYNDNYYDIIIGSQIISQGLNFLNIANAYVVNVDDLLFINEYNANERTYNLLSQMIGRVGRNLPYSEVYIESNHSDNFVMRNLKNNDYLNYYNEELQNRRALKNPPYYNICKLELRHSNYKLLDNLLLEVIKQAKIQKLLVSKINIPYVQKIGEEYRRYVLVKYKREDIKSFLNLFTKRIKTNNIRVIVDLKMITNGK